MITPHRLSATRVGNLALQVLREHTHGQVGGVFSNGLAFMVGERVLLLSTDLHGWPYGIGLPSLPPGLSKQWLGAPAECSSRSLSVEALGLELDLTAASVWDGRSALSRLSPSAAAVTQAARLAREALRSTPTPRPHLHEPPVNIGEAIQIRLATETRQLCLGIRSGDRNMWSDAVESLLGLGPGLTPAGDDILAGLMLALHSGGHLTGWTESLSGLLEAVTLRASGRTTPFGASSLHAAVLAEAPEVVVNALAALYAEPAAAPARLRELLAIGATSGRDTLMGLSAGLDLLDSPGDYS